MNTVQTPPKNPFQTSTTTTPRAPSGPQTAEKPTPPLTREDFFSAEDYLRWLRESGFEPSDAELETLGTSSPEALLARANLGWTERQRARSWGGWGESQWIKPGDFGKAYNAVAFANRCGVVMNVHMTIVWPTVGKSSDLAVAGSTKRFLELFRKWCGERQLTCYWVHVLERGTRNGLHSHILASVPHLFELTFRQWAEGAIKTVTGKSIVRKARGQRKGTGQPFTLNIVHRRDDDIRAQWEVFKYLMKGIHPRAQVSMDSSRQKKKLLTEVAAVSGRHQGLVTTKRVGTSRTLGKKRRDEADFRSVLYDENLSPSALYTDSYFKAFELDQLRHQLSLKY